jgi:hypothetical protein
MMPKKPMDLTVNNGQEVGQKDTQPKDLTRRDKILMFEYYRAQEMATHYDRTNMQFTSIVTAAVFVLWGLVFQVDIGEIPILKIPLLIVFIETFIFFILYIWIQYTTIHRRIVVRKFNRVHEIERELGMKQHLMFKYNPNLVMRRPGGHSTEIILFGVLSSFGVCIALYSQAPPVCISLWWNYVLTHWRLGDWLLFIVSVVPIPLMIRHGLVCKKDVVSFIEGYVPPWYTKPFLRLVGSQEPKKPEQKEQEH